MHYYRNVNTSDVAEREERSPRLEALENWRGPFGSAEEAREDADGDRGLVILDGVLHRAGMSAPPTVAPRSSDTDQPAPATTAKRVKPSAVNVEDVEDGEDKGEGSPSPSPRRHRATS